MSTVIIVVWALLQMNKLLEEKGKISQSQLDDEMVKWDK